MFRFLGILTVSGYHTLPEEAHYWTNQPLPLVSEATSSKRFMEIKRYLHTADNIHLQTGNKAAKRLPLYNSLNQNLVQFGIWQSSLSTDESMVPYFGRHSIKMFICGKPIRLGYKLWCLCGPDGFPYHMKIDTGKDKPRYSMLCRNFRLNILCYVGMFVFSSNSSMIARFRS